ncbi:hypothetical protein [Microvirga massiliensis]|uniref:hypothetical protein n=1 Tax=Microvirga massiliensis TaxID=1033741 RepID=UPI00062B3EB2|nr:hypothetical protein [Microvirga massiliensis]
MTTLTVSEANTTELLHPDRCETAAIRDLEPHELDAVGGGREIVDLRPLQGYPDLAVMSFLAGFYRTCGC